MQDRAVGLDAELVVAQVEDDAEAVQGRAVLCVDHFVAVM